MKADRNLRMRKQSKRILATLDDTGLRNEIKRALIHGQLVSERARHRRGDRQEAASD